MTNLAAEVVAYLRYEREPIEPWRAARELARLARLTALHEGRLMARCPPEGEYIEAMAAMVRSGELVELNGRVRLFGIVPQKNDKQGELF